MQKETVIIPELEAACEKKVDRYVEAAKLTKQHSLRYHEIKRIARECKAIKMRKAEPISVTAC